MCKIYPLIRDAWLAAWLLLAGPEEGAIGNMRLFGPLPEAAAAAAAATAASGFDEFPFKKEGLLMNGDKLLRSMICAAAADCGIDAAAIAEAGQKLGKVAAAAER